MSDLSARIEEAGYRDVVASVAVENGYTTVTVEALTPAPRAYSSSDVAEISTIVWETYPRDFDLLLVVLNGYQADALSREELRAAHGQRPERLVRADNTRIVVLIVVLVSYLLLMGAIAAVLVMVLRRQARTAQQRATPWWPPPPPPPPPPPGYYPGQYPSR